MIYLDKNNVLETISLTLGDADTTSPPPLALSFTRKGTNESVLYVVPVLNVTAGEQYVTIADIPTATVTGTGQFELIVYDYTVPGTPVEIERGLCIVLTDNPINKPTYGTDKTRSEYKGHI